MPQEQFQRVKQSKIPVQKVLKKIEIPQSQLAQETMRPEIRRMKLEKTFGEQGTLCQVVVRIVSQIKKAMEMEAETEHHRGAGDQQNEINLARGKQPDRDSVEQHPSVQDPGAQARQKQKRTRDQQACLRRYEQRPRRPTKRKTSANPKLSW